MNIILIRPYNSKTRKGFFTTHHPINLCYLASTLQQQRHTVEIWDYCVEPYIENDFISRLKNAKPDVAALTALTPHIIQAGKMAETIKKVDSSIITMVGGVHASGIPQQTAKEFPAVDIVFAGEGEQHFVDAIRKGDSVYCAPLIKDMDFYPIPNREILPLDLYRGSPERGYFHGETHIAQIYTSRGCPCNCTFCASNVVNGGRIRYYSKEHVEEELEDCMRLGFNHITVEDDTITINKSRLYELCDLMRKNNLTWNCNSRVDTVNKEILQYMKDSGCEGIAYGIESGCAEILKKVCKHVNLEQAQEALRYSSEVGITNTGATFILGIHPDETMDDVEKTVKFLKEITPYIRALDVSVGVPYPGTAFYEDLVGRGWLSQEIDWNSFNFYNPKQGLWESPHLDHEVLCKLQRKMLRQFHFRFEYIKQTLKAIKSLGEIWLYVKRGAQCLIR